LVPRASPFPSHVMRYHQRRGALAEPRHRASAHDSSPQEERVTTGTIDHDMALHGSCAAKVRRFVSRSADRRSSCAPFHRLAIVMASDGVAT
jgi:hypothetical protein